MSQELCYILQTVFISLNDEQHMTARKQRHLGSRTKPDLFPLFLHRAFSCYLIIVVRVKSTPGTLGPGGTDGGGQVKLHTSALWQTGVWTWVRLRPARHGGAQIRRGVRAVFALGFPVWFVRLVVRMMVVPSLIVRVLHNALHLWVVRLARMLE